MSLKSVCKLANAAFSRGKKGSNSLLLHGIEKTLCKVSPLNKNNI